MHQNDPKMKGNTPMKEPQNASQNASAPTSSQEWTEEDIRGIARERYYVSPSASKAHLDLQAHVVELAVAIVMNVPTSRDRSIALTELESVLMRAGRGICSTPASSIEFPNMVQR